MLRGWKLVVTCALSGLFAGVIGIAMWSYFAMQYADHQMLKAHDAALQQIVTIINRAQQQGQPQAPPAGPVMPPK